MTINGKKLFYAGFPAIAREKIVKSVKSSGGAVKQNDDNILVISGISIPYDKQALFSSASIPSGSKKKQVSIWKELSLAADITDFNLTDSTPVECMNFISLLQKRLNSAAL